MSGNGGNQVTIQMDCFSGTIAGLTFISPMHSPYLNCGDKTVVDSVGSLRKKGMIAFVCDADNPSDQQAKMTFTIEEIGGNSIVYSFPDDFSNPENGVPEDEDSPYLTFYCKFE